MTWNVAKRSILCSGPNEGDPLTLAVEMVGEVTQAEYLGVSMTFEGIAHHHCLKRISKAKERENQLRSAELNNTGFHPPINSRIYISLVRSMTEFQIHFTPWTNTLEIVHQSL